MFSICTLMIVDRPRDRRRDRVAEVVVQPGALLNRARGVVLAEDRLDARRHARIDEPHDGAFEIAVLLVDGARIGTTNVTLTVRFAGCWSRE